MKFKLFFILFTLNFIQTFAQERMEFEFNNTTNRIRIVPLKENGFIYLNRINSGSLYLKKVDVDMNVVWDTSIPTNADFEYLDEYVVDNFLYVLFENKNAYKYEILKISTAFAANQKISIQGVPNFSITHFNASDNFICLGGSVNKESLIIFYDEENQSSKLVSASLNGETNLQTIDIKEDNIITTFINTNKVDNSIVSRIYSKTGKVLTSTKIEANDNFSFISAKYFETNGNKLIVGNFGLKGTDPSKYSSSQGIFITKLTEKVSTKFYSFDKFKNFLNFLNNKQQDKIEKRIQKQRENGQEYRYDYRLLVDEIGNYQNNLVVTADVFMPEYRNSMYGNSMGYSMLSPYYMMGRMPYGFYSPYSYGNNYGSGNQIFDGFRYLEGIIFMIDEKGNLLWDQSMNYNNVKYYKLKQHINLNDNQERVIVSYKNNNNLVVNEYTPKGNLVKNVQLENKLKSNNAPKKDIDETENFEYWYDSYFINWGIDKSKENDSKKHYLFVEKVSF